MKYISEERLMEILSRNNIPEIIETQLTSACQELYQLTVTKLRPMSEAKDCETVLAYNGINFEPWYIRPERSTDDYFEGWIPMPEYKLE